MSITDPSNALFVSAASAWEIAIKVALGRLGFPMEKFDEVLAGMGVEPLPIDTAHAIAAGGLPRHHDDPFDRMLIAQCRLEGLTLVTEDEAIRRYDVKILRRGPDQ